jgi:ribonuclease P/MRP protein subunit RPP1
VNADLCVRTDDFEGAVEIGKKLGLDVIGIVVPPGDLAGLERFRKKRDWREKPRIATGVEIKTERHTQVRKYVQSVRGKAEVVLAIGGTDELNRAIVEISEVDILLNHVVEGRCGINHVLAKIAKKNSVSVGFDFNSLVCSYRLGRIREFSAMEEAARAVRKYNSPFALTSGAQDPWDMRSVSELLALGSVLGFSGAQAKTGLSDGIARENKKRLSGKWIMPGVEIV